MKITAEEIRNNFAEAVNQDETIQELHECFEPGLLNENEENSSDIKWRPLPYLMSRREKDGEITIPGIHDRLTEEYLKFLKGLEINGYPKETKFYRRFDVPEIQIFDDPNSVGWLIHLHQYIRIV